jgi:hypothetical protein
MFRIREKDIIKFSERLKTLFKDIEINSYSTDKSKVFYWKMKKNIWNRIVFANFSIEFNFLHNFISITFCGKRFICSRDYENIYKVIKDLKKCYDEK